MKGSLLLKGVDERLFERFDGRDQFGLSIFVHGLGSFKLG